MISREKLLDIIQDRKPKTAYEALTRLRRLFSVRGAWTKCVEGRFRDRSNTICVAGAKEADILACGQFCLVGGHSAVVRDSKIYTQSKELLRDALARREGDRHLTGFNDRSRTRRKHVLSLIDSARRLAKKRRA